MRGFTLVELLVVLFIAGLLSAASVLLAAPGEAALAEREARRLAALLEAALAEARASGQSIGWSHEAGGYAFWRRAEDGEWIRFPDSSAYRRRALAGSTQLREVRVEARELAQGERTVLPSYGFRHPFSATFAGGNSRIVLRGNALGRFTLERIHAG